MRNILIIIVAVVLSSSSAALHLNKAEKHIGIAIAKGAKLEDKIKTETDTIVKDTVIYIEGSTLDDSFSFVDHDTVFLESKEGVKAKVTIDSKKKKGNAKIDCPDKEVKVPQKYYVNRTIRITRTLSAVYTLYHVVGFSIFGLLLGLGIGYLLPRRRE